ncbi:Protein of unknown function [Gryllus bimaculatus]|nr:Protein of unknown function [Gryllus bimaculatus]
MKTFALLLLAAVTCMQVASQDSREVMNACMETCGVEKKGPGGPPPGGMDCSMVENQPGLGCITACILKKEGMMNEDGSYTTTDEAVLKQNCQDKKMPMCDDVSKMVPCLSAAPITDADDSKMAGSSQARGSLSCACKAMEKQKSG